LSRFGMYRPVSVVEPVSITYVFGLVDVKSDEGHPGFPAWFKAPNH
jgi:hypothetical protein